MAIGVKQCVVGKKKQVHAQASNCGANRETDR